MEQISTHRINGVFAEIRDLIEKTKLQVAVSVNAGMTLLYWHIGERINREILGGERATYGQMIVEKLANKLTSEYGGNQFSKRSLHRMMQFASTFPDLKTVTPLVTQLSWSHFLQVISMDDVLKTIKFQSGLQRSNGTLSSLAGTKRNA